MNYPGPSMQGEKRKTDQQKSSFSRTLSRLLSSQPTRPLSRSNGVRGRPTQRQGHGSTRATGQEKAAAKYLHQQYPSTTPPVPTRPTGGDGLWEQQRGTHEVMSCYRGTPLHRPGDRPKLMSIATTGLDVASHATASLRPHERGVSPIEPDDTTVGDDSRVSPLSAVGTNTSAADVMGC
jgi:hypothetical protein